MAITPFRRVLAANRGEIAVRIFRASTELGFRTVAIFSEEDRVHLHRYKADEAYLVGKGLEPVAAYLAEDEIVELAKRHDVDAIHPGYGLLSERASFARKCRDAGIVFIGPTPEVIDALGDKVAARKIAEAAGRADRPRDARAGVKTVDGGARVRRQGRLPGDHQGVGRRRRARHARRAQRRRAARSCSSARARRRGRRSATTRCSSRSWCVRPKHIEVQILGDNHGNLVHLFERDCSVQRRHQKVVEYAPAWSLPPALRARLADDALKIARHVNYSQRRHRRVPGRRGRRALLHRGQPAHPGRAHRHRGDHRRATWCRRRSGSRRATSCPTRRSASPARPTSSSAASRSRCASPPRIRATTSCPTPGKITGLPAGGRHRHPARRRLGLRRRARVAVLRLAAGQDHRQRPRVELRPAQGGPRAARVPHPRREDQPRVPRERAVAPDVRGGQGAHDVHRRDAGADAVLAAPRSRDAHPALRRVDDRQRPPDGARQAEAADVGAVGRAGAAARAHGSRRRPGTKQVLEKRGAGRHREDAARGPARAATPTPPGATRTSRCWRRGCAPTTSRASRRRPRTWARELFSLEMWGGATFDVAYRFLSEDPWLRLEELRRLVPNVMFQMLVRGANAVGYTNYPDDVVSGFIEEAAAAGMDVFRIFDALNDVDNMQVAIEAAQKTRPHRRDGDLLHGRRLRSAAHEVRPQVLRRPGQGDRQPRHAPAGDQGHGGPAQAARGDDAGQGAARTRSTCRCTCTCTTPRATASRRTWRRSTPASTSSTARSAAWRA